MGMNKVVGVTETKFHRGPGGHQEEPKAHRAVGYQDQATATPPDFHIDDSGRPGATRLPIIDLEYVPF
jgi:hypothetical protein